jgi:hypothetical protein
MKKVKPFGREGMGRKTWEGEKEGDIKPPFLKLY